MDYILCTIELCVNVLHLFCVSNETVNSALWVNLLLHQFFPEIVKSMYLMMDVTLACTDGNKTTI